MKQSNAPRLLAGAGGILLAFLLAGCGSAPTTTAVAHPAAVAAPSTAGNYTYMLQASVTNAKGTSVKTIYETGTIADGGSGHATYAGTEYTGAGACRSTGDVTYTISRTGAYAATVTSVSAKDNPASAHCAAGGADKVAGQVSPSGDLITFGSSSRLPGGGFEVSTGTIVKQP